MATSTGIKSKDNVKEYGEVFTPDSIVNDMLTLVDNALKEENVTPEEYIMKTYLEPSCGDGQFLIRILDRKLACIVKYIPKEDWELYTIKALTTIYGIDIQQVNVDASKDRMIELLQGKDIKTYDLPNKETKSFTKIELNWTPELERIIKFILDRNIQCGNTLESGGENEVKITEFIWNGRQVQQKKYGLGSLDVEIVFGEDNNPYRSFVDYTQLGTFDEEEDEEELDFDDF